MDYDVTKLCPEPVIVGMEEGGKDGNMVEPLMVACITISDLPASSPSKKVAKPAQHHFMVK